MTADTKSIVGDLSQLVAEMRQMFAANPDWYDIGRLELDEYQISLMISDIRLTSYLGISLVRASGERARLSADFHQRRLEDFAVCAVVGQRAVGCSASGDGGELLIELSDGSRIGVPVGDTDMLVLGLPSGTYFL